MIAAANVFMAKTQSRQPGMIVTALSFFLLRLGAARPAPGLVQMDGSIEITPSQGCILRCTVARGLTGASSKSARTLTASSGSKQSAV
jgi:hypothetical protein